MDSFAQAAADEAWLRKTLGRRYLGCELDDHGTFTVTIARPDGRHLWVFRETPEAALAAARAKLVREQETALWRTPSTSSPATYAAQPPGSATIPAAPTQASWLPTAPTSPGSLAAPVRPSSRSASRTASKRATAGR